MCTDNCLRHTEREENITVYNLIAARSNVIRWLQQLSSRAQWLKTVNYSITTLSALVTSCRRIHQRCACVTKTRINPLVQQGLGLPTAFPQPHLQTRDTPRVKVGSQSRLLVLQLGAHPGTPISVMRR